MHLRLTAAPNRKWHPKQPKGSPLTRHARGWVAKIAGKTRWVAGQVTHAEAIAIYHRKAATISSGQAPIIEETEIVDAGSIHDLLNRWNIDMRTRSARGDLSLSAWTQYRRSARRITALFGHYSPSAWNPDMTNHLYAQLSKAHGDDFAKRAVAHLRSACRYAEDMGWCAPVKLGRNLVSRLTSRPSPVMHWRLYTPAEIAVIIKASLASIAAAGGPVHRGLREQRHAWIFLALNGGLGARELAELTKGEVVGDIIDHRRGKTGKQHLIPLWPETVAAIEPVLKQRPDDDLLFRTIRGNPVCFHKPLYKGDKLVGKAASDAVAEQFESLVRPLGLKFARQGFYKLKHLASTVADSAGDPHATFALFGHALPGVKSHYVAINVDRLRRVVDHMRRVLLMPANLPPAT